MSISKRKAQRVINSSLSADVDSSGKKNTCSLFKNQDIDLNVIGIVQQRSSRKCLGSKSSNKKKNCRDNQSKDNKENRVMNYPALSKILDQKNVLVHAQQKQIQQLKSQCERVKKQLQQTKFEFDRKKLQDLNRFRKQEIDNQENIKQLEILRVGIRQLKNKIQSLEHEKQILQKKNCQYEKQNEDLTLKLTSFKEQYLAKLPNESIIRDLQDELIFLKQETKQIKQLQMQKKSVDERCHSLQQKLNNYMVRYNQIQTTHNEIQVKYYRLQKENDDLKMQIEELQISNSGLRKMLEQEKKLFNQQMIKWKERISKFEQIHKNEKSSQNSSISELEEKFISLEQNNKITAELTKKDQIISALEKKCEQNEEQITLLKNEINILTEQQDEDQKNSQQLIQSLQQSQNSEKEHLKNSYELKIKQLQQRLFQNTDQYHRNSGSINGRFEQVQQKCLKLQNQLDQKHSEFVELKKRYERIQDQLISLQISSQKHIQELGEIIEELKQELCTKDANLQNIQKEYSYSKENLEQLRIQYEEQQEQTNQQKKQIVIKIQILEENIRGLQTQSVQYQKQLSEKDKQIQVLKSIVRSKNDQLTTLKRQLQDNITKFNGYNLNAQETENKYKTEILIQIQKEQKLKEQLSFVQQKYDESFKQGIQMSQKLCHFQRQFTQQVNKNTELIKINSMLECQIPKMKEDKNNLQKKKIAQIQNLNEQIKKNVQKIIELEASLEIATGMIQKVQSSRDQKQERITFLSSQLKNVQENYDSTIAELKAKHSHEVQNIQINFRSNFQQTLQSETARFERQLQLQLSKQEGLLKRIEQLNSEITEKNKRIQQNYEIINSKEKQIQNCKNFRSTIENEQNQKLKQINSRLSAQVEQVTRQFEASLQQLKLSSSEVQTLKSSVNSLQKQIQQYYMKNQSFSCVQNQLQMQVHELKRQTNNLKQMLSVSQTQNKNLKEENGRLSLKNQHLLKDCKKLESELNKATKSHIDSQNKKNKQLGRQLQGYKTQLQLLMEENKNLQTVMDQELGKRKQIIEELIQQKKMLYIQIANK